jgi:hypothetical protein
MLGISSSSSMEARAHHQGTCLLLSMHPACWAYGSKFNRIKKKPKNVPKTSSHGIELPHPSLTFTNEHMLGHESPIPPSRCTPTVECTPSMLGMTHPASDMRLYLTSDKSDTSVLAGHISQLVLVVHHSTLVDSSYHVRAQRVWVQTTHLNPFFTSKHSL